MPTNDQTGEDLPSPVTPPDDLTPSPAPVLTFYSFTEGGGPISSDTKIECKVSDGGELLIKIWPEEDWRVVDYSNHSHVNVLEKIALSLLQSYQATIRGAEVTITDSPESCRTDIGI